MVGPKNDQQYRPGDVVNCHRLNASGTRWEPLRFASTWDLTATMVLCMARYERTHMKQTLFLLDRSRWAEVGKLCQLLGLDTLTALALWHTNMCTATRLGYANGGHVPTRRRQRRQLQQQFRAGLALFQFLIDNDPDLPDAFPGIWPQIAISHHYMTTAPGSPDLAIILEQAMKEGHYYFLVSAGKNTLVRSDDPHGILGILTTEVPALGDHMATLLTWAKEDGWQRSPHQPLTTDPRAVLQSNFYEYPELAFIPRYT